MEGVGEGSRDTKMRRSAEMEAMKPDFLLPRLRSPKLLLSYPPSMAGDLLKLLGSFPFDFGKGQIPILPVLDARAPGRGFEGSRCDLSWLVVSLESYQS